MLRFGIILAAAIASFAQPPQIMVQKNPAERERLSETASRAIERAAQARDAIDKKDKDLASHYVQEALQNLEALEIARPHAKPPLMVTLYTEMIQFSVTQPVLHGTGFANRSAAPAQQGNDKFVRDAEGEATRVSLNATSAKSHLQAAQSALEKNDLAGAREALAAVDKDVTAESVVGDLPLLKARQNLGLALNQVRQGHYNDAVAPLQAASAALGEYAGSKSRHAPDAAKLKPEIDKLAGSMAQNQAAAANQIAKWWDEVSDWFMPLQPPPAAK